MTDFSDFIVFADESGDHGLTSIDPQFPVFASSFACLIRHHIPMKSNRRLGG
ncbi:DUF3800 domain-containing protein [Sphingomonas radiodurans]|uniref:DUF3800 domain-containing protein n=1 Tax=Sphingomonas radiodurans TaxID=2890321 RepID=UPI001E2F56E7|nr:DUF3800 domain-containing protein [Sphingomonas radiodurans]WBH17292.1 DUF3800 domain-containing protein [Sphingomonas radiodurans]